MRRTPFLILAAFSTALMAHAGELPDFSDYDTDTDGRISEAEFVSYATSDGQTTEAEAVAEFAKFDANADGAISMEEYVAATGSPTVPPAGPVEDTGGMAN